MASTSNGSTSTAASPATSSVEVPRLVTTGVPCAMASSTGRPEPFPFARVREHTCGARTAGRDPRPGRSPRAMCRDRPALIDHPSRSSRPRRAAGRRSARRRRRGRGRFLRGSNVPTKRMNSAGGGNDGARARSPPLRRRRCRRPGERGAAGRRQPGIDAAARPWPGSNRSPGRHAARWRRRLLDIMRAPWPVYCSGWSRNARSCTVTTSGDRVAAGTSPVGMDDVDLAGDRLHLRPAQPRPGLVQPRPRQREHGDRTVRPVRQFRRFGMAAGDVVQLDLIRHRTKLPPDTHRRDRRAPGNGMPTLFHGVRHPDGRLDRGGHRLSLTSARRRVRAAARGSRAAADPAARSTERCRARCWPGGVPAAADAGRRS